MPAPDHVLATFGFVGVLVIVFVETGFVAGFFLPGDSLLFTSGVLAALAPPFVPIWRHACKAVLFARFVPVVRTVTPMMAGASAMPRRSSASYAADAALPTRCKRPRQGSNLRPTA